MMYIIELIEKKHTNEEFIKSEEKEYIDFIARMPVS